jgi:ABC-type nitrate/sulfonate/bicarbonate transport system substrate-binding protein
MWKRPAGRRVRPFISACTMVALIAACIAVQPSAEAQTTKTVKLGYATTSGGFGAFWLAKEKGFFKEEGLNAELLFVRTTVGLQALATGDIDAMGTGCAEFFEANRKGFANRVVANLWETNLYMLVAAKGVTDPKMLVGKTIAVNRIGDTGHMSVRYALRRLGVDPDKITYVQVGSTPERFSALVKGVVAGAVQVGSLKSLAIKNDLPILLDLQTKEYPSCLGGIGFRADTLKENPAQVTAMLRAIARGNIFLALGPAEETKQIFSKYMKLPPDNEQLVLGWSYFSKDAFSLRPKITIAQVRGVMDMLAESDPSWKNEEPSRYIDQSFMDGLDKSGYLDRIYNELASKAKN